HEEAEVRNANTDCFIYAVYRNCIGKEALDFMFESVLLMFQEHSKVKRREVEKLKQGNMLVEDVAKLLKEHDLPRLDGDKYEAKGAEIHLKQLKEQPKVLAFFLKAEKQKKKTINEEKDETADKEGGKVIGKDIIDGEENETAEVEGETAEVENEFDKEESVVESKEGETTDEDNEKESEAEDV
ncbi:11313_t:CDS:2, partial [Ambispora gerdemannii]